MSIDQAKLAALAALAVEKGADMTVASTGGGDYTPPAEGPCRLRFVSYVELGKHTRKIKGVNKTSPRVQLIFELSGKNHEPDVVDGVKIPKRITIEENLSLNEKANFFKLFQRMNYKGTAKHMVSLLGEAYRGIVVHDKWNGQDGKERISAQLRNADGYTISPPRIETLDPETEQIVFQPIAVDPVIGPLKYFLWDHADLEQWGTLFIDGEYPERRNDKGEVTAKAKSKNVLQNKIKLADNFKGSPIHQLLAANGGNIDIPDVDSVEEDVPPEEGQASTPAAVTPTGAAATSALNAAVDPLAGVV